MSVKEAITKPELNFWISIIGIVISIVVSVLGAYAVVNTRLALVEQRQDKLEDAVASHIADNQRFIQQMNDYITKNQSSTQDIQVKLAQIQTDIQYIKQSLGR